MATVTIPKLSDFDHQKPQKVSELTHEQKKVIRQARFENTDNAAGDSMEILQKLESEKQKRIDRALKFGIESQELQVQKRTERMARFKAE